MKTNPRELTDIDFPLENHHIKAWIGNNVLCYVRGNKLAFNHSTGYVYKSQLESGPAPPPLTLILTWTLMTLLCLVALPLS